MNGIVRRLTSCGCGLAPGAEAEIVHWPYQEGDEALDHARFLELWLPVVTKQDQDSGNREIAEGLKCTNAQEKGRAGANKVSVEVMA